MKNDRRRYARYTTRVKAQYFLKDHNQEWTECIILDVSSKGMGIVFLTYKAIDIGSTILLEIPVHEGLDPITIVGLLRWITKKGNDFIGGIESTEIFDAAKLYHSPLEK